MQYSISRYIEKRASFIGFSIYFVLVFILPFILINIARLADHELMHYYIVPYSKYKFVLIVISGLLTGMVSKHAPFINSLYVGLLGLLVWLIFSRLSAPLAEVNFSFMTLLLQSVERVSLCAAGGLSVAMYRCLVARYK